MTARIGVRHRSTYAVTETFQLLKIRWEWYNPDHTYDVVIARREELPKYTGNLIDLTGNDYFQKIQVLLNEGKMHLNYPSVEYLLKELSTELKKYTLLIEIPPAPFGHPYIVAFTHDVDFISVKQSHWRSVIVSALRCFLRYEVPAGIKMLLAKVRLAKDPWDLFERWKEIESKLNIRSTFFIIPAHNDKGVITHQFRDVHYTIPKEQIKDLQTGGWEVGVHGIDNWKIDTPIEKESIRGATGNRTHWLLHDKSSWQILDRSGYEYDTTFGYDDDIGFRAGTLQVYQPEGVKKLLELPLHIQDMGLFGEDCWALDNKNGNWFKVPCLNVEPIIAKDFCRTILNYGKQFGGVITVLWHYENITEPRNWLWLYKYMVKYAQSHGAWITTAKNAVDWFRVRRAANVSYTKDQNAVNITVNQSYIQKALAVRVHIDPEAIQSASSMYTSGEGYIDIRCDNGLDLRTIHIRVVLKK